MFKKGFFFQLLLCSLGIFGTVGCFLNMYVLPIENIIVFMTLLITMLGSACYYANTSRKRNYMRYIWILYGILIIATFFLLKDGFAFILNTMYKAYEANSQYTFTRLSVGRNLVQESYILYLSLWIIFTPVILIITRSMYEEHSYSLGFAVTIPFLFSILLFTLRPDPLYFNMLLTFYFALVGMGTARNFKVHNASSTIRHLGSLFLISGMIILLMITILFPEAMYVRSPRIENIRVTIQTAIRALLEDEYNQKPGELDLRSAGNRYYINTNQLAISMEEPQTLFLHGYSGTYYDDNRWLNIDYDTSYTMQDKNKVHPLNFALLEYDQLNQKDITITYENKNLPYIYTPYYLMSELRNMYTVVADQYIYNDKNVEETNFKIADVKNIDKLTLQQKNEQLKYFEMVKEANLQVPEHIEEYFNNLEIEGMYEQASYSDKINIIQGFVQGFGRYTLHPGTTPDDQDFVLYFLQTSKEGYCVHYATTAVLLLRHYGIPARYASGYRVDSTSFINDVAVAKDYNEHAWVEIFDPVFGWVPLEVTPASLVGSDDPENPTLQPNQRPTPSDPVNHPDPNPTINTQPNADSNTPFAFINTKFMRYLGLGILMVIFVMFLPCRHFYKKQRHNKKMNQSDVREAILYCGYYLEKMEVVELDPNILHILNEAKYSTHSMLDDDRVQVIEYCAKMAKERHDHASKRKRFMDSYIHGYY